MKGVYIIMSNIADKFEELGVIPVVVLNDTKDALPLAKALVEGGLPCAEVTFRTEAAEESIRLMHEAYPDMVLAAGTVLTTEQVDRAVAAGASVIVSPGFDPEIVDYCISKNIPVMPGIVTPSELAQAVKRGLTRVKFFPATAAGGIKMIKAMCAAYTTVRIMPTGGINTSNLEEFLSCDKIFCCGGSWMVKGDLIKAGEFDKIKDMTAEAVALVKKMASAKFDETVEAHLRLGVDGRHADQQVRGAVVLPHGTGKTVKVLVFAKGAKVDEALAAGADYAGGDELVPKIQNEGWLDFDVVVATPDMMGVVGRLGRVLGPKGLMPNPKAGTVTMDVAKAISDIKAGKIEYRLDKANIIHVPVGKVSFTEEQLNENFQTLINAIVKAKPAAAKGQYLKSVVIASTMGPGVKINTTSYV